MIEREIPYALTFDDILLLPQYSEITPTEVVPKSLFARGKFLNTPIISAAMDTVTENRTARVMAQFGGLGIIHKNLDIDKQTLEVEKVKKYESGMIMDPLTLGPDNLVQDAVNLMEKFSISGVPITIDGTLVGILTNRDLRFEENFDQPIRNLMTKEHLVTAKMGTTLEEAKKILQKHRIEKLPVVDAKGKLKGLITIKDIEKAKNYPQATKDEHGRLFVGAAVGVGADSRERADSLVAANVDVLCVDTAHGHSKNVIEMVKYISQKYKDVMIIAGNVVTAEGTHALIEAGADVFLLDDGFQHQQLARDVDILLIDAARSLGKEMMLPTGRLREPISAMSRADFLIFTRTETAPGTVGAIKKLQAYPVFSAATQLVGFRRLGQGNQLVLAEGIGEGPFYVFCGIGNPRAFFLDLQNWGVAVVGKCEFADHHRYDARDARELIAAARRVGASALVTTEKDEQNLSGERFEDLPVYVAVIDLAIDNEEVFLTAIRQKLDARKYVA